MTKPNAQTAIDILSQLRDKTDSATLAYWVAPNAVLTLSGARAYCNGVFYSDNKVVRAEWMKAITDSIEVIKSVSDVYLATAKIEKSPSQQDYAAYDVIMLAGLDYVFEHTALLGSAKPQLPMQQLDSEVFMDALCALLRNNEELPHFSDENLQHIAFGILVGYPDKAILGAVSEWESQDPFAEPLIDADIRGSGYYICPQPVYSYPRHLVTDGIINAHERLWSEILKDFYTSDFHKVLAKDPQFERQAEELRIVSRAVSGDNKHK